VLHASRWARRVVELSSRRQTVIACPVAAVMPQRSEPAIAQRRALIR